MIYYNLNTINDWNFGDDNIIKVYKHGAVCYYKITSGDTPTPVQEPCFAVVDDITLYSDAEFEDVFNKADGLWYKLNNLNQYEEYGIYGSGRSVTTYNGKLTIDNGYEYIYSGGSWVNLGEVTGTSITIKSPEYIEKTSSFRSGYIDLDYVLKDNSMFQLKVKPTNNGGSIVFGQQNATADNNGYRIFWASGRLYYDYGSDRKYASQALNNAYEYEVGNYYVKNLATSATVLTGTTKSGTATSMTRKIGMWETGTSSNDYAQIFYVKIYEGNTLIRDLIPWTDMNGNYGMFDKLSLTTYRSTNALTASTVINDVEVGGGYEYPLEYPVKQDPPDNLVFSSMTEAEEYECPWVGMHATIDGDNYVFSGDSQSGYEWVENQHSLPDVPFVLNYNAKQYNASTHSIPMTSGQLNDTDAIAYNNPSNIADHSADGYITISNSSMRIRKLGQDISLFNRSSNSTSSDLTIVCKAKSTNGENIITNRDSNYNWMYRLKTSGILRFHGTSETGSISWNTSNPDIMSVRTYYDSGTKLKYNNWTQNTSTTPISFTYGSTNTDSSAAGALFVGYAWSNSSEQWSGDFYWVYMCQGTLTDEQVQQVIDYNENL